MEQARKLCLLGATDDVIARFFDVTDRTLRNWKQRQPEFAEALKLGKLSADTEVVSALYEKAKGGDVTACIYWLKNRQPEQWRDRVAHEVTGAAGGPIKHETTLDVTKLTDDQLRALASIAVKGGE
ncbi:hypothetical protein [Pandoraea commovens]|uniref:hypothetical protein n=1 Tax=Pandoraea commovens TaxID=2508289 RepID=UPI0015819D5E|nr:hypothetical protein [Pandoraea commovens]